MIKTRLHSPYLFKNGQWKTFFKERKKAGVYIVIENGKIVYVGYSGNDLYRTMYRHFQSWNDGQQYRAVFDRRICKVRVIYCTEGKARKLEAALILKYKPKYNENTYDDYEADNSEIKVLNEYFDTEFSEISEYKGEVNF